MSVCYSEKCHKLKKKKKYISANNKAEGSELIMDEIRGISCEVKNCVYHDKSDCCTAGHITVGNSSATKTSETKCETFECCESCGCR